MKSSYFRILFAAGSLIPGLRAAEPAIIAKARAYLGTEDALDAVHSIHMTGSMESMNIGDPGSKQTATVDIVFQKPQEERLTVVMSNQIVRTGLDGFNAWHVTQDRQANGPTEIDPNKVRMLVISGPSEIESLRADTFENLYYYRGIEQWGGSIQDLGPVTIDGIACEKVLLRHAGDVVYTRYFDNATGRLVFTEGPAGAKLHESGEQVIAGVKFPKTIIIEQETNNKPQRTVLTIEQIETNHDYPASFFATPQPWIPPVGAPAPSAAAAAPSAAPAPAPSASAPSADSAAAPSASQP